MLYCQWQPNVVVCCRLKDTNKSINNSDNAIIQYNIQLFGGNKDFQFSYAVLQKNFSFTSSC